MLSNESPARRRKKNRGQSTIEYLLMVAFGAIFAIQIAGFFNDIFKDGLKQLEGNVEVEMATGARFRGAN